MIAADNLWLKGERDALTPALAPAVDIDVSQFDCGPAELVAALADRARELALSGDPSGAIWYTLIAMTVAEAEGVPVECS